MTNKKLYCINCSKTNHLIKDCNEPIYSYGIICLKLDESLKISPFLIENFLVNKLIDIEEYNFSNLKNLDKIDMYKDKIKFLFIQRKHSFSYVEFIRGKYDENNQNEISNLLNLMAKSEIEKIMNSNFSYLWNDLWQKTSKCKIYQKEFEMSQNKFNLIKNKYKLSEIINFENLYETPEWGFPKGRKDKNEKIFECAKREFEEETGITQNKYLILDRLNTIEESVVGTENKLYKLVYYLGLAYENIELEINNDFQKYEVGDIKWLTFEEIIPKVRPYFKEKITMIYKIYFLMISLIENIRQEKIDIFF